MILSTSGSYLPPPAIAAAIIAGFVTLFGGYIGALKYLYDGHTSLDQLIRGSGDQDGFVDDTEQAHQELAESQREIERTLQAHGALLQELVHTCHNISSALDEDDELSEVNTRRLEHLEETLRDDDDVGENAPEYGPDDD